MTTTRLAAAGKNHDVWTRALILTPSASRTMSSSPLGDPNMAAMSVHFVKPHTAVAMTFSSDPQPGMTCDRFSGSAISALPDTAFCEELTRRHGVAAIPLSPFCDQPPDARLIRFCFAKEDGTLEAAAAKLRAV